MNKITDETLISAIQSLTTHSIYEVLESDTLYHLYFKSEYGLISCSYSKNAVVKILYKERNGTK